MRQLRSTHVIALQGTPRENAEGFHILFARGCYNFSRQFGPGRNLGPANAFEIITHELFVERGLRAAWLVLRLGPEAGGIGSKSFIDPYQFAIEEPKFKFSVGKNDAARLCVCRSALVKVDADRANLASQFFANHGSDLFE